MITDKDGCIRNASNAKITNTELCCTCFTVMKSNSSVREQPRAIMFFTPLDCVGTWSSVEITRQCDTARYITKQFHEYSQGHSLLSLGSRERLWSPHCPCMSIVRALLPCGWEGNSQFLIAYSGLPMWSFILVVPRQVRSSVWQSNVGIKPFFFNSATSKPDSFI